MQQRKKKKKNIKKKKKEKEKSDPGRFIQELTCVRYFDYYKYQLVPIR